MKDNLNKGDCLKNFTRKIFLVIMFLITCSQLQAQNGKHITGVVIDENGQSLPGVTVMIKGATTGTITDLEGNFSINVSQGSSLILTCIGYEDQEIVIGTSSSYNVTMKENTSELEEVVVVGYGQQKKASVVGAITQTTGAVLERAAGVNNIGAALTGNLPGVVTSQGTGIPGGEDPKIVIRGASSWNNSDPLILVDGIEREMGSVDISSVESISVLKDASATAIYGVRGANGVILITTKRGQEGKAKIDVNFTSTMKSPSKLPNKYDSYDALMARNSTIEMELPVTAKDSWEYITPQSEIEKYRNQTTQAQRERYPNVDWVDALFKDYAMSYNANINISGGTKVVKYFASADYTNEGDLMKTYDNGRGYKAGYDYNRINARSNLDFQVTKYTVLKLNLAGSLAISKRPANNAGDEWQEAQRWSGAYNIAPDVFLLQYEDGAWGYYPQISNVSNSVQNLAVSGIAKTTTNTITTDFNLNQDLSFWVKGLSINGTISWDNTFQETGRGIGDAYNDCQQKWIDPETGEESIRHNFDGVNRFDWVETTEWSAQSGSINNGATYRRMFYQGQLNYARTFGDHDVSGMGVFKREESATGSNIPAYREEWAFRATYNYKKRYSIEYNGCYNGSEKFSSENRFAFFNSGGVNWTISEEPFMNNLKENHIIDVLKLRASYGEVGSDWLQSRWLYMDTWAYGGETRMDPSRNNSIYTRYRESQIGNPDVHWEISRKFNLGLDYNFLGGLIGGSVDIFNDKRSDILISGSDRSVPAYFGGNLPTINKGKTESKGIEVELRIRKEFKEKGMTIWGNMSYSHNENKIITKDDPELSPNYQKQEGYAIGQEHSFIDAGFINNIDELYGSPSFESDDQYRLPGNYYIVDFNGDGIINSRDAAPYGYTGTPQNTYNATIGFDWKGFSCFAQFYGVTNVTRDVTLQSFGNKLNTVYDLGSIWSVDNQDADYTYYHWCTAPVSKEGGSFPAYGSQYKFDGSYIRLKNIEFSYTWHDKSWIKNIGFTYLKVFVNGNNVWLWSRMPDDREANLGGAGYLGAYPTVKRFNIGIKFSL